MDGPLQKLVCQRVLDIALNYPPKIPGAEIIVKSFFDEISFNSSGKDKLDFAVPQLLVDARKHEVHDLPDMYFCELVEIYHLVDSIQKFRAEQALQLVADLFPGRALSRLCAGKTHFTYFLVFPVADVRRHDYNRVAEADRGAGAVGELFASNKVTTVNIEIKK